MSVGQRIEQWLKETAWGRWVIRKRNVMEARAVETKGLMGQWMDDAWQRGDYGAWTALQVSRFLYIIGGDLREDIQAGQDSIHGAADELKAFHADPQAWMQAKLHEFGTSDGAVGFAEFVGTIITEPVVSMLEQYAGDEQVDPHDMARAFHGIASGLPFAAETLDNIMRALLKDRAPAMGKLVMSLYWGLGLGFLGWQTLAPLLSSGLQPNLNRYYLRLYRPERFGPDQMRDLFALGEATSAEVANNLRDQGWRDEDISKWLKLAHRTLSEGTAWKLFQDGHITKTRMDNQLRQQGYKPADLPLLYLANQKDEAEEIPKFLASTAKRAFREDLITEAEFRETMAELNFSDREIGLQVALITDQKIENVREFSTGQIKNLYQASQIGADEATAFLVRLNYAPEAAGRLVALWLEEASPKVTRLNKSTITQAYSQGVLTRNEAKGMLQSESGYGSEGAELILRVEDATIAASTEVPTAEPPGLGLALLRQLFEAGLLTQAQLEARPELSLMSPADRALLVDLFSLAPETDFVPLDASILATAYLSGLITREQFLAQLVKQDLSPDDAELAIQTVDAQRQRGEFIVGPQGFAPAPLGLLADWLATGLISVTELATRPELDVFSPGDKTRLIALMVAGAQVEVLPLDRGTVEGAYVYGMIDRDEFIDRLVSLGLEPEDAELAAKVFEADNPATFGEIQEQFLRRPSAGQLQLALQRGLIDDSQFRARLGAQGYNEDAITVMSFNAQYVAPIEPRDFSTAQVIRLFKLQKLSRNNALQRLLAIQFTIEDASLLLEAETLVPEDTEIGQAYLVGWMNQADTASGLSDLNFTNEDIEDFFVRVASGDIGIA